SVASKPTRVEFSLKMHTGHHRVSLSGVVKLRREPKSSPVMSLSSGSESVTFWRTHPLSRLHRTILRSLQPSHGSRQKPDSMIPELSRRSSTSCRGERFSAPCRLSARSLPNDSLTREVVCNSSSMLPLVVASTRRGVWHYVSVFAGVSISSCKQ